MKSNELTRAGQCLVVMLAMLFSVVGTAQRAGADIESGLTAYWKLDETSTNTLYEETGTWTGGVIYNDAGDLGVEGRVATAFSFDGVSDGDKIDTLATDPIPAAGSMSIFAWIRTSQTPSPSAYIVNNYVAGEAGRSILGIDDQGRLRFFLDSSSIQSADAVTDGVWHHVGVTRTNSEYQLWIDGRPNGETNTLSGDIDDDQNWFIGGRVEDDARNFEGHIDEVRLYDRALSASEVASLFAYPLQPTDWVYYKDITIDASNIQADLTNFPVLISLAADADLAAHVTPGSSNIAFALPGSDTILAYDIESYDGGTGSLAAWVRVPLVDADGPTTIRMFYGGGYDFQNAPAVWQDLFEAVWHMNRDPGGTQPAIPDATAAAHDATANGSMDATDLVTGQIGSGLAFDGANDYLEAVGYRGPTGAFTASLWFSVDDATTQQRLIGNHSGDAASAPSPAQHFWLEVRNDQMYMGLDDGIDNPFGDGGSVSDSTWTLAHFVFDGGTNLRCYVNGSHAFSLSSDNAVDYTNPELDIVIGRKAETADRLVSGILDEVRLAPFALSAEWIDAEHANQGDPGAFYNVSAEQFVIPRGSLFMLN